MDSSWLLDLSIILFLILLNGVFAMSEIALISSKPSRLEAAAARGSRSAAIALRHAKDPTDLLSTVQVGITLIGIINGAFGGARFSDPLAQQLIALGLGREIAATLGYIIVVTIITYLSLIIGELVPKRIALVTPERVTMTIIPALDFFSKMMKPFVFVLSKSTLVVYKLLGLKSEQSTGEAELEIKQLLSEGMAQGDFAHDEVKQVERLFAFHDRYVYQLMQPRTTVEWIDLDDSIEEIQETIYKSQHNKLPVGRGSLDQFIGFVEIRELLSLPSIKHETQILKRVRQPLVVPRQQAGSLVLQSMQQSGVEMAFVLDEYGGFLGVVTLFDILEEIIGEVVVEQEEPSVVQREDGSYLADGMLNIDEAKQLFGLPRELEGEERAAFHTLAGFVITGLGTFPKKGDVMEAHGLRFEIVDMDGRRIDQVLVQLLDLEPSIETQ
ncbi:hemolysin family protein [Exiguobacterium aurantiacum]|uniref:Mg2+ and Co2+ transporter CorB n=1 Tax=Exiguobacterium aurantiacum TaxID=33987 RepID=A0A377FQR9_9BACL|nr:hemolysin family protein [Exiguobacterium aurantiacum]STO07190.1 Putative Mg2+ and Co2+ transporter CorB [Exiguobacterium aurantiacum]